MFEHVMALEVEDIVLLCAAWLMYEAVSQLTASPGSALLCKKMPRNKQSGVSTGIEIRGCVSKCQMVCEGTDSLNLLQISTN